MRLIVLFLLALSFFHLSLESTPFTAHDLHKLARMSGGAISPDGKHVVYSLQTWNHETGKLSTSLFGTRLSDRETFQITPPEEGVADTNPVFSKEFPEFLFFLSNRNGQNELFYVKFPPKINEKPKVLSKFPLDIDNLKISAKTVAFTAQVYHECADFECTVQRDKEIQARGSNTYTVYDQMFVRHWDEWDSHKVSHVFVSFLSLRKENGLHLTHPIDVLVGLNTQSPVPPDGGAEQFDISEDGSEIALTAQVRTRDEAWRTDWKVYHVKVAEKWAELNKITEEFEGRTQNPRFSPNMRKIGFLAMSRKALESDSLRLVVYTKLDGTYQKIDHDFDRSIDDFIWIDNENLLLLAIDNGNTKIYAVDLSVSSPKINLLYDDAISTSSLLKVPGTPHFVAQRNSFTRPTDFWYFDLTTMSQITFVNAEALLKFEFIEPELFYFTGGYNDTVQGWVIKPIDFQVDKSYPIAFLIHGGPESPWSQSWSYRWNPQLWTSRGYAVLMINPHGSPGQGQKFTDAVINNWGGVPYEDLMTGLDFATSHYSWMNNDRACAVGASYGGYMVNWIQGQTNRFRCLITHDGVFSTVSMFYATEEIWFPMAEYCPLGKPGCTPWEAKSRKGFEKYSPERYVANWQTPHLIFHGSRDYRIPISEGLSVFTALQVKKIPSRFVHFHEENHWVLRRENSIKWYEEVLGWLDAWTQEEKAIKKED